MSIPARRHDAGQTLCLDGGLCDFLQHRRDPRPCFKPAEPAERQFRSVNGLRSFIRLVFAQLLGETALR